ncbi:MAG: hypothetical protein H2212_07320 [Ruminococcus sp.]|nr:hypothetical protein [Ruminococcus sp.]
MFELTINDQVYQFNFGMGFLRETNKRQAVPVDGVPGAKKNIGCRYTIAGIIDKEPETLVDVLFIANEGQTPRLSKAALDKFVEDENTNIDEVFEAVLGFLETANATKNITKNLQEMVEKEKAKQEAVEMTEKQ